MNYTSSKFPLLIELAKGQDVLDIGCVQHSWKKHEDKNWIHNILRQNADSCVGIDILEDDILNLQRLGYDVRLANAEDFQLRRMFTLVYIGECLEHLSNVGKCLNCCYEHLKINGKLVITVPNCFSWIYMWLSLRNKLKVNTEHTCWYDEATIRQVLERHEYKVDKVYYFNRFETGNNQLKNLIAKIFSIICPYKFRDNILVVARK